MRGRIIAEERFLHQGIDHHLFVTGIEGARHQYRFEVRRILPGHEEPATEFEKTVDFSDRPDGPIEELLQAELRAIKQAVTDEEALHAHDP